MANYFDQFDPKEEEGKNFFDQFDAPKAKKDTGFTGAFKAGTERLKGDVAALAGRTGIMDVEKAEKYKKEREAEAEAIFEPTQETWGQAPVTKVKELLGGSLPYMAAPIVAGGAATAAGAAAPIATGLAGVASLAQFTGSNLSRQMDEGKKLGDTDLLSAGAAAVPQAALDMVSFKMTPAIRKIFGSAGKELTQEAAEKIARQGVLSTAGEYALQTGKTAGIEGTTEAAQQFFERLQAGLSIKDQAARDEYLDSFIGGAVLGGTISPAGQFVERMQREGQVQRLLNKQPEAPPVEEPSTTEAFAIPGDKEAIEAARWEEARKNSPTMQALNQMVETKKAREAEQQARIDEIKARASAFSTAEPEGGVFRAQTEEELAAEQAKAASFSNLRTVAVQDGPNVKLYEGQLTPNGKMVSVIDPETGKTRTFNPNSKNVVIDPTEKDIFAFETKGLGADLKTIAQEIKTAQQEIKGAKSEFEDWLKKNPIRESDVMDILPEAASPSKKTGFKIKSGAKPYFSKDGSAIDDLTARALEDGILTQEEFDDPTDIAGQNAFIEKLTAAYNKQPVETAANKDAFAREQVLAEQQAELQAEIDRRMAFLNEEPAAPLTPEEQAETAAAPEATGIPEFEVPEQALPLATEENVAPAEEVPAPQPAFRAEIATPFTDKFIADEKRLARDLRKALDKMGLKDVGLALEDTLEAMVGGKMTKANATYFNKLISVALSGDNMVRSLNHEAIHAMKDLGFFTDRDWKLLSERAEKVWMDKYNIAEGYAGESKEVQIEEAIAHAFGDRQTEAPAVKSLMTRALNFLKRIGNFLRARGYRTVDDIFTEAAEGKFKATRDYTPAPEVKKEPAGKVVDINSDAFKKWLGNSIFAKDGKPQVLYHGTKADIKEFRVGNGAFGRGIYLATDPEKASTYARNSFGKSWQPVGPEGGNVLPLFVRMENPKVKSTDVFKVKDSNGKVMSIEKAAQYITDQAKAEGHDGIIIKDPYSGKITEVIAFDPNQVKSAIGNTGEFSRENADIRAEIPSKERLKASLNDVDPAYADKILKQFTQEKATVKEKFEKLKTNFFDRMMTGLFDEFRAIKKYDEKSYMQARLSKSIDGALQGLLEYGEVFNDGGALNIRKGSKGLLQILEPVGAEVDQYQIWKALNRDANLASDKRSFDPELVTGRDRLASGTLNGKPRKAVYEQVLKEENELNKSVLKIALDGGLIDKEGFNKFSSDIYYIPFYKMMEDGDVQSVNTASKLTGQQFSKMLKGGEKKVNDLMENVLMNWSHILSAAMKNQAAKSTLDAAEKMGAAEPAKMVAGKYPAGTVKVMQDGQAVHYNVSDPDLVDAISTISYLGPKSMFLDVAKGFTNALRYGITMSPAYKVRNLIRDSIQSASVSELGGNIFGNVYNGLAMSKDGHPTFMAALAGGGIFEMGTAHEGNQSKLIKRLIDKGVNATTILDTPEKIKANLQKVLDAYNEVGNKFENANRLALYQKLIDSGKSHLEASYASRDLMDFSMQGQFRAVKILGSVVPFFNARLQGLYKLGRDGITPTYRVICNATTGAPLEIGDKQKAARFMAVSSSVALASILLYGMYKDDEDFKRREDWDRDNFWWFKVNDTIFRIPKPFEIGALGTIAERTYEQIADDSVEGKIFTERLHSMLADTFSLNPIPQMVKPMIDLYANKDSFTGAPIESGGMERLSKQERINNSTSGLAIALGGISQAAAKVLTFNPDAEGFSPVQMDYGIKAYFGWLGATAASTADLAVEPFTEGTKVRKPVIDTLAMGFVKTMPETQSKYMTQFYTNNARIQSALADMRHYAEMGESEKVEQIFAEKGNDIMMAKMYDKTSKNLAELRKQSRMIEQAKDIPVDDKRAEMNRLKIMMSDLAAQVEEMRKELKKQGYSLTSHIFL